MAGGMGGMGGGLMGTLMRSAMGGTKDTKPEVPQITADEYDVDRWKRADDLDNMTMVQAVRSDWDQRKSEKLGLGQKLKTLLNRREKTAPPEPPDVREAPPAGGTITTPEMKKATQRIHASPAQETAPAAPRERSGPCSGRKNYLGLDFQTEIGGFFTENPVNSAILAVDSLGLGPLTMNQVTEKKPRPCALQKTEQGNGEASPGSVETGYMDALRQSREQRKFEVRVSE